MRLLISRRSKYPLHEQIKEQIKLAISLGHIRPGYSLPSIRELEKELGIGRNIIHRAYRELAASGIITIKPRSRIIVSPDIVLPQPDNNKAQKSEVLIEDIFRKLKKYRIPETSFAEALYQRAISRTEAKPQVAFVESIKLYAEECAAQVSTAWRTPVIGTSIEEFRALQADQVYFQWILTSYQSYEDVVPKAKAHKLHVAPVVITYSVKFIAELAETLKHGKVLLVYSDEDYDKLGKQLTGELRSRVGPERSHNLEISTFSKVDFNRLRRAKTYRRVYLGSRLWDTRSDVTKCLPYVEHPEVEVDSNSLQQARITFGFML